METENRRGERRGGWELSLATTAVVVALAGNAGAQAVGVDCAGPAGDPDPRTQSSEWRARDFANVICATQRLDDEYGNPAFGAKFWADATPRTYSDDVLDQLAEPTRPRLTLAQWIAGGETADPFRLPSDWENAPASRGRVQEISFVAADGAKLVGRLFTPNHAPAGGLPAVVITTGSIQGYQELYHWAAEGLAEAGYMVLTYDVQGQGRSETFPHRPDGAFDCQRSASAPCPGVPFQQGYNFYQGTRDALDFLLSTPSAPYAHGPAFAANGANAAGTDPFNPLWQDLDRTRIGLAGHSLGASAVSVVGQFYPGIAAIVAWDALAAVGKAADGRFVDDLGHETASLRVPALSITAEYFFNPAPADPSNPPNPDNGAKTNAFRQLKAQGTDTMLVQLRSSTHLEFTYVPYILPASRYGERVAMYYTRAWLDRYLKGDASARSRLTATVFDGTSDESSIGAGTYDAASNANVPNRIAGDAVANRLSVYYLSRYWLDGGAARCDDMRHPGSAACP